jgi:hypothetical protein
VASGPWAPLAVEQRANAFAAAFLMPSWWLGTVVGGEWLGPMNEWLG